MTVVLQIILKAIILKASSLKYDYPFYSTEPSHHAPKSKHRIPLGDLEVNLKENEEDEDVDGGIQNSSCKIIITRISTH